MWVRSPAKINLFLHIISRLKNGHHQLETGMQFIDFFDFMHFHVSEDETIKRIDQHHYNLPQEDLILKSASLLQSEIKHKKGVCIKLIKNIPPGSGLGGGSSNAATTLLVLNELWHANLSLENLKSIAINIGADVPFFIERKAGIAQGIGEIITPKKFKEQWCLLGLINCQSSTEEVFKNFSFSRKQIGQQHANRNDLTQSAKEINFEINDLYNDLSNYGEARMSGSGSSCFLIFDSYLKAYEVSQELTNIKTQIHKLTNIPFSLNFN